MEDDYNRIFESEYQKIQQAKNDLREYQKYRNNIVNYKTLIDKHFQSLRISDSFYQKKAQIDKKKINLKNLADQLSNKINELKERISELDYFDKNLKDEKSSLIQMHKRTIEDIRKLNSEKNRYYQKIKENNRVTSQYKTLIKETCGEKGKQWYYRNYTAKGRI